MRFGRDTHRLGKVARFFASGGALLLGLLLTGALFLLLPILENIATQDRKSDLQLISIDTVEAPPPPVVEEKQEEPQVEEEPPPELVESAPPLDLSQLEFALNPGTGDGLGGDFAVNLNVAGMDVGQVGASDDIFALADLDQAPRIIFQPAPQYPADLKKRKVQGTVYVLFIVDKDGRVQNPKVQKSDNPGFDAPATTAVRKWRFEPGKVSGQPVQFRMRVPITFAL